MPEPRRNESKQDFINRCVEYIVENENRKPEQATAMCYSIWEESKKKKSIVIKILKHSIYNSEPTILLNDILINASISKKVKTKNILLTHSHQINLGGINKLGSGNIHLLKSHDHFLKHHIDKVEERFQLNYIETYTPFEIDELEIYPILTKHLVQEIYKEECLGYIVNRDVAILTPCYKIPKKSKESLKDIKVLIIDGGYRTKALYQDHKSILDTLQEFKNHKNLKHIYFLGTYRDYKIKGKIKDTNIKVDTLFTGDILKIK
jgi:phosphoribosyl 1,2-cyclic phosphodiesterase